MAESSSNRISRMLSDLRVIDLKNELEIRGLEKSGVKQALFERLKTALIDGGHDPEKFTFEIPSSLLPTKSKKSESSQDASVDLTGDDGDASMNNQITIGFEEDYTDLLPAKSKDDLNNVSSTSRATLGVNVCQQERHEKSQGEGSVVAVIIVNNPLKQVDSSLQQKQPSENNAPVSEASPSSNNLATSSTIEVKTLASTEVRVVNGDTSDKAATTQCTTTVHHNNVISIDANALNEPLEAVDNKLVLKQENTEVPVQQAVSVVPAKKTEPEKEVPKEKSVTPSVNQAKAVPTKTTTQGHNLWVSGLSSTTRAADLKNLFSKHGKVMGAKVVTNAKSPGSKCYGFVTMSSFDEAGRCIKHLNRNEMQGRIISVERAKSDPSVNSALNKKALAKAKPAETAKTTESEAASKKSSDKKAEDDKNKVDGRKDEAARKNEGGRRDDWKNKSRMGRGSNRGRYNSSHRRMPPPSLRNNHFMNTRRDNNILNLEMIRETREREREREMERLVRQEERRQQAMVMREKERQRVVERMQREEAGRLAREKEKLRLEKQKLELDKIAAERERVGMERERQRREREKLEREREERKKEIFRHQSERKESKRAEDSWMVNKRKVLASPVVYPSSSQSTHSTHSRSYGVHNSVSKRPSVDKKHLESKSRHVVDSSIHRAGVGREESKARKLDERSRVEWRSVSKNEQVSMHHRSPRDTQMPAPPAYHYPGGWSSNTRPQMPPPSWYPAVSYSSFGTPLSYMPPPSSAMPNFPLSRTPSNRYEPYKTSRRY